MTAKDLIDEGLHGCQTGDCPHLTQDQCDKQLKIDSLEPKESDEHGDE